MLAHLLARPVFLSGLPCLLAAALDKPYLLISQRIATLVDGQLQNLVATRLSSNKNERLRLAMKRLAHKPAAANFWIGNMRGKTASVEQLQAITRYEKIRTSLLNNGSHEYLEKPLAHWVLPADRRLPLAFLGRSLGELLEAGFDELAATPGVGQKKIRSFLNLLARVAESTPPDESGNGNGEKQAPPSPIHPSSLNGFNPDDVSEIVWSQWQNTVQRCGLAREPIGRVAPTLRNVTRVIWHTPLGDYLGVPLDQLREQRTYGEKRVRAVLEVFFGLHQLMGELGTHKQLAIRLVPRQIDQVERWVGQCLQRADVPNATEISECFIVPLIEQLRHDSSQQIVQLAETRLGIRGPLTSVRRTARQMGLTRARVYQLLNETNDILTIRWPLGRCQSYHLLERMEAEAPAQTSLEQFRAALELFYPSTRRGAAGAVEKIMSATG